MKLIGDNVNLIMTAITLGDNMSDYIKNAFEIILGDRDKYINSGELTDVEITRDKNYHEGKLSEK